MSLKEFMQKRQQEKDEDENQPIEDKRVEEASSFKSEPISVYDTQVGQAFYDFSSSGLKFKGKGFTSRPTSACLPVVYATKQEQEPVAPEKPEEPDEAEERKREYRRNVVTSDDLRNPTEKVIKNTNPQDLRRRYIFMLELEACKNGFLYYIIPFLFGLALLIYNFFSHDFSVNAFVAGLILIVGFSIKSIFKNFRFVKLLIRLLIVALCITAFILCVRYLPNFRQEIYVPVLIKLLIIIYDVYCCARFYTFFTLAYAHDCQLDFGNSVRLNAGKPRSGKTSNGVHDARILALKFWAKLQYDFWDWHSREEAIIKRNNRDELLEYHEIKLAYNFYIMRPCIPCLFSNIGIQDRNGNVSHKVELAHIKGVKRLPLYTVVFLDEIGAVLKADLSNDKKERPYDVSDMFRLGGHFLKWAVICCEQDFNNVYIDVRRVVGFNQLISGQEWICRPGLLYWIFSTLKFFISDSVQKKQKKNPLLASFMHKLENFVRSIGFRRYNFEFVSNTQTKANINGSNEEQRAMQIDGKGSRIVPAILCVRYSDRAYKQLYASYFDKDIKAELHDALHISGLNLRYGRQFVNTSNVIDEKREAIDNYIRDVA